jgi:hypothetical protein
MEGKEKNRERFDRAKNLMCNRNTRREHPLGRKLLRIKQRRQGRDQKKIKEHKEVKRKG